ncbi:MAG TPA: hypothetical protein VMG10_33785 [Gemmataceae bacterium]|nr:hypothetical protein [Gemmataceae bacterium]
MKWFRLATSATLVGVLLAAGCASPCGGGCGTSRRSMFRARTACPCECCSNCGGGVPIVGGGDGVPIVGAGPMMMGEGPLLEPPGPPLSAAPPLSAMPPPVGTAVPGPLPPNLGAPFGTPAVPADPGRLTPIPNMAQPLPADASSRIRSR